MKSFKGFLTEKLDCKAKFEKIIFGSALGLEKDTPEEAELWKRMLAFIKYNSHKPDVNSMFDELKDCQGYFKDQLIPTAKMAYRGTALPLSMVNKMVNKGYTKSKLINGYIKINAPYTYRAHEKVQSWSSDHNPATAFGGLGYDEEITILLVAKVDNTFIMNSKVMSKLAKAVGWKAEDEIVRIDNSPIRCEIHFEQKHYEYESGKELK